MDDTILFYEDCEPKLRAEFRRQFANRTMGMSDDRIEDYIMIMGPIPYIVRKGGTSDIHMTVLKMRRIIQMLKISPAEIKKHQITLNLATRDVITDMVFDKERNLKLGINLTKKEKDIIWNFPW